MTRLLLNDQTVYTLHTPDPFPLAETRRPASLIILSIPLSLSSSSADISIVIFLALPSSPKATARACFFFSSSVTRVHMLTSFFSTFVWPGFVKLLRYFVDCSHLLTILCYQCWPQCNKHDSYSVLTIFTPREHAVKQTHSFSSRFHLHDQRPLRMRIPHILRYRSVCKIGAMQVNIVSQ